MVKIIKPKLKTDPKTENVKLAAKMLNDVSKWVINRYSLLLYNGDLWSRKDKTYKVSDNAQLMSWINNDFELLTPKQIEIVIANCINFLDHDNQYNTDKFKDVVYFKNGIYNLKTQEFEYKDIDDLGFSPNVVAHDFNIIPKTKLKESKFINLNKFLNIYGQGDVQLTTYFLEMFGSALTMRTPFSSFFVIFGEGNTGKSTLNRFISKIIGSQNSSTFALRRLTARQSALAETMAFYGKTYVYDPDSADITIKDMSDIKQLTGGDIVTGKYLYQNNTSFENVATIVIITNHAPKISETGKAIDRRLGLFPLPKDIDNIEESKKVPLKELDDMINDEEVQQQFILLALTAFSKAITRGHMTKVDKLEPYYRAFKANNNDIYRWLVEEGQAIQIRKDGEYDPSHLFNIFENWAKAEKLKDEWSRRRFTQALNASLKNDFKLEVDAKQSRVNGRVVRKYSIINKGEELEGEELPN